MIPEYEVRDRDALYQAAGKADDRFQAALEKQFGKNTNRFEVANADYNAETLAAYWTKIACDKMWLDRMAYIREKYNV